ncbi:hypothetical protein AVEN_221087-1 [Araneus ventricosus]|uniref:Uncharacterized protein n=1 Tax=Araneus ventricosus TaxID=182803 RepID=A0A4Y2SZ04_ARAVE|nr:hypothetical protein AVEN_221087-1 [Araneus ventricosus]
MEKEANQPSSIHLKWITFLNVFVKRLVKELNEVPEQRTENIKNTLRRCTGCCDSFIRELDLISTVILCLSTQHWGFYSNDIASVWRGFPAQAVRGACPSLKTRGPPKSIPRTQ